MKYEENKEQKTSLIFQEKRSKTDIYTVEMRSLLNKATGFMSAYGFIFNPYRGCQYGCSYCCSNLAQTQKSDRIRVTG